MSRHDVQRTGDAGGVAAITSPGSYWRTYLGGRLSGTQVFPIDLAGQPAIAYISSGRVEVATTGGTPVWSSENLGVELFVADTDLDGDGRPDLVVRAPAQVFVFDTATGVLEWTEDASDFGAIQGVLAADADGDGLADLVIEGCTCCRVANSEPGFVYTFAGGFANARRLWELPFAFCGGPRSLLVADIDGDGDPDVLLGGMTNFEVLDGSTGAVVATSPSLGTWVGASSCEPVDLDSTPGKELVCVHGTDLETAGAGHRVFALHDNPTTGTLDVLWSRDVGDLDQDITIAADFVHDLDGDGTPELAVTGTLAAGTPETVVLDARSGDVLATVDGETVDGVAALPERTFLITHAGNDLSEWTFARGATSPLTLDWRLNNRAAVTSRDWALAARQPLSDHLLLGDVDGDGHRDLYTVNTKARWVLFAHSLVSPAGATVGSFQAATGAEILAAAGPLDGDAFVSTSDGRLTTLSPNLTSLGSFPTGGYYADGSWGSSQWSPVVADINGNGSAEVIVADSRGSLIALDARTATNAAPPSQLWDVANTSAPAVVGGLGPSGGSAIACRQSDHDVDPPVESVSVLDSGGHSIWSSAIGPIAYNDVVPGNFDGDAVPDLVVQWGLPGDTAVRTTALAGTDGHSLWTNVTQAGVTRFPPGAAVTDWNHDGIDDVVFHHYGTRVLSGTDGSQIAIGGPQTAPYFTPMLVDVTGDGVPEITLHGGFSPLETLASDLSAPLWASTDDERPYPYAAATTCAAGPVLVSGSLAHSSRLKVTLQAGTPGAYYTAVLADGALYADEAAATAAGASVAGQLTSVYVHENLTGRGHPSAVVGSSDGWLYAVDPCTMTLDWAMPFGVPVGAVAFGDTDGDGLDEIIVSTADGYLHGLKQQPIAAPAQVRDVDPALGNDVDVDEITTDGSLSAAWDAVPGATGYQVAVAYAEGGIVSQPAWTDVSATFVTFANLSLTDGTRYVFAVRAVGTGGVSPDMLSDGVLVHLQNQTPLDGGIDANGTTPSRGGCCGVGDARDSSLVLSGLLLLVLRRRPGRRRGRATPAPPRAA